MPKIFLFALLFVPPAGRPAGTHLDSAAIRLRAGLN